MRKSSKILLYCLADILLILHETGSVCNKKIAMRLKSHVALSILCNTKRIVSITSVDVHGAHDLVNWLR